MSDVQDSPHDPRQPEMDLFTGAGMDTMDELDVYNMLETLVDDGILAVAKDMLEYLDNRGYGEMEPGGNQADILREYAAQAFQDYEMGDAYVFAPGQWGDHQIVGAAANVLRAVFAPDLMYYRR